MISTILALGDACQAVMTWEILSVVVLGTIIGHVFGLLPGLSGMVAVSILIPITYDMSFVTALAFLISILGAGTFGGSITAILIAIPGTSTSVMTVIDGYPLAKQGRALYAIVLAGVASALGSLFSIVIFIVLLPLFNKMFFLFGAPEKFLFILLGLVTVAFSVKGQVINGLLGGVIGILVSLIGFSSVAGGLRFTMDIDQLWDGVASIPFFVGTFAVAEFIDISTKAAGLKKIAAKPGDIVEIDSREPALKQVRQGTLDVLKHWFLFARSSVIGFIIGFIPGIGGSAAQMITYTHAVQSAKDKSKFGHGDIRGIIAPESANNAKDVGQLLPTFGLGIPGSVEMSILLGAFMIHGIQPGTNLFDTHLSTVWVVIVCLAIANILSSAIGITLGAKLVRWLQMPPVIYMSVVIGFALLGAYVTKYQFSDIVIAVIFGFIGYAMKIFGINRVTFVVAFILGEMLELYFWQSATVSRGNYSIFFVNSAATVVIWLLLLSSVIIYFRPELQAWFKKNERGART